MKILLLFVQFRFSCINLVKNFTFLCSHTVFSSVYNPLAYYALMNHRSNKNFTIQIQNNLKQV